MLKVRIRGLYLRGEIYWFAKQANGRRSMVSLETRDYAEAVQRAREILESPELQPAQSFTAEFERFLAHKLETNRYSPTGADGKRSCLTMFADSVKNIPPTNVTGSQCKAFYFASKQRIAVRLAARRRAGEAPLSFRFPSPVRSIHEIATRAVDQVGT